MVHSLIAKPGQQGTCAVGNLFYASEVMKAGALDAGQAQ